MKVTVLGSDKALQKAASFARFSRSLESFDTIWEKMNLEHQADELLDRVLAEYGDDSVQQLASFHVVFEGISIFAAKEIERSRTLSFIEKSSRYVEMKDTDFYRSIEEDQNIKLLFEFYRKAYRKSINEDLSTNKASKAKALDLARGLLPLGTLTTVGAHGSAQAFENLVFRLLAAPYIELKQIGELLRVKLIDEAKPLFPNLTHEQRLAEYVANKAQWLNAFHYTTLEDDSDLSFFSNRGISYLKIDHLPNSPKRENRRYKVGRELEFMTVDIGLETSYATFRDLQRHRMGTIEWQQPNCNVWISDCEDNPSIDSIYEEASNQYFASSYPKDIYSTPMCASTYWRWHLNFRELIFVMELRSQPQGHPAYRRLMGELKQALEQRESYAYLLDTFLKHFDESADSSREQSFQNEEKKLHK